MSFIYLLYNLHSIFHIDFLKLDSFENPRVQLAVLFVPFVKYRASI